MSNYVKAKSITNKGDKHASFSLYVCFKKNDKFLYLNKETGEEIYSTKKTFYSKMIRTPEPKPEICVKRFINEIVQKYAMQGELQSAILYLNLNRGNNINNYFFNILKQKNGKFEAVKNVEMARFNSQGQIIAGKLKDCFEAPYLDLEYLTKSTIFEYCKKLIDLEYTTNQQANTIYNYFVSHLPQEANEPTNNQTETSSTNHEPQRQEEREKKQPKPISQIISQTEKESLSVSELPPISTYLSHHITSETALLDFITNNLGAYSRHQQNWFFMEYLKKNSMK